MAKGEISNGTVYCLYRKGQLGRFAREVCWQLIVQAKRFKLPDSYNFKLKKYLSFKVRSKYVDRK